MLLTSRGQVCNRKKYSIGEILLHCEEEYTSTNLYMPYFVEVCISPASFKRGCFVKALNCFKLVSKFLYFGLKDHR